MRYSSASEDTKDVVAVILVFIATLLILPLAILWGGFVVSNLWNWLIVPILPVSELSFWQGAGLSTFISYFTMGIAKEQSDTDGFKKALIKSIAQSLLMLLIGYLLSLTY